MKPQKSQEIQQTTEDLAPPIQLTDAAAAKIYDLVSTEGDFELKLRLYIVGGGCAGFEYGFAFDKNRNPDDEVIQKVVIKEGALNAATNNPRQVQLIIDAMSLQYLTGSTVDYVEGLRGSHFTVINPNASTTCGCGSSFSVE